MKFREYTLSSPALAQALCLHLWEPEGAPQGVVCVLHGQGEHAGRYTHLAYFFSKKGYAVAIIDLPGHGRSEGQRGHVRSYADYLRATDVLVAEAKRLFPRIPIILYGHSLGGNIAVNYALEQKQPSVDLLILSSPWLGLAKVPPPSKVALAKIVRYFYPAFSESNGLDPHALSKDPKVARQYLGDAMVHNAISAEAFFGIQDAAQRAISQAGTLQIPTLLMHGDSDSITSSHASQEFAYRGTQMVSYKEWNNCMHELHNEREWKDILAFAQQWIDKKLQKNKKPSVAA